MSQLFDTGESFFAFPFKCVYKIAEKTDELKATSIAIRVMVSVGKRYHKRAVRRNRVKRLTREAYRLNKVTIYPIMAPLIGDNIVDICYIYTSKKEEDFKTVENGIRKSFEKLAQICKKSDNSDPVIVD